MRLITETNENELLFVVTTEKQTVLHEVISVLLVKRTLKNRRFPVRIFNLAKES